MITVFHNLQLEISDGPPGGGSGGRWGAGSGMLSSGSGSPASGGRLIALLHSSLRDEQIYRLFDICPGLVDIRPQANRVSLSRLC